MNWLAEYFSQRASTMKLSLLAQPPFAIGPDGPIPQPVFALPYPGIDLVFTPGAIVEHEDRRYALPPHYDSCAQLETSIVEGHHFRPSDTTFFNRIAIYAPSAFNPDFLVTINDAFAFVPVFAADGSPAFVGLAKPFASAEGTGAKPSLPWTFQGYLSI